MKLIGIAAIDQKNGIGKNNSLPWNFKEDLAFFKETTGKDPIIMGRKTYESIGRVLPNRRNLVISNKTIPNSNNDLISITNINSIYNQPFEKAFVIGGSEIFKYFLDDLEELYLTHINNTYNCDTFFPEYKHLFTEQKVISKSKDFTIIKYTKK